MIAVEALDYLFGASAYAGPKRHALPQMMLLDLKLPRIDGLEVLQLVRTAERTRFLPVIILTSSAEQQDLVESYRLGANSYVRKPVAYDQFSRASQTLGLCWFAVNLAPAQ